MSARLLRSICLWSSLVLSTASAQDPPIQWGVIPREDLAFQTFPSDTDAAAVILCDYGQSFINDELNVVFERHRRIKILSQRGYDWGTHSVVITSHRKQERLYDFEAATYFLDPEGTVVIRTLDDDDIFEEDVDERNERIRFTLPALTPGCVIEYRYTIEAKNIAWIRDWEFQTSEPVLWSEYRVRTPRAISYSAVFQGYETIHINEQSEELGFYSGRAASYLGRSTFSCSVRRWVFKNLPALRTEPYITTTNDYLTRVDVQLAGVAIPGGGVEHISQTWSSFTEELRDSKFFGDRMSSTGDIRALAAQLTAGCSTPLEKVEALYRWVTSSLVWTGEKRYTASTDLDDILEAKRGTSAEINFVLLSLLKASGVEAHPIILSTRDHGKVTELYPIQTQFNYLIVGVPLGPRLQLLDGTNSYRPMDLFPTRILKTRGLMIRPKDAVWVDAGTTKTAATSSLVELTVSADGSIRGTLESQFRDYAAARVRSSLREKKDIDVVRTFLGTEELGIEIDSVAIEHRDSTHRPLMVKAWFESATYVQRAGDRFYLNPQLVDRMTDNPFKRPGRRFPVDFPHGVQTTTVVKITLPKGIAVKEAPLNRSLTVGSSDASFTRKVQVFGREIQLYTKFEIQKTFYTPDQHEKLRELYAAAVSAQAESMLLETTAQ